MDRFMLTITADGQMEAKAIDKPPPLHELKAGIGGGWLEHVPYFDSIHFRGKPQRCVVFVDEEGKLKGQEVNRTATDLWYTAAPQMRGLDALVGSVVILIGDEAFIREI